MTIIAKVVGIVEWIYVVECLQELIEVMIKFCRSDVVNLGF